MDYIDTKNNDNDYLDTRLPAEPELKRIAEEYILEADSSYDWTMGEEFDTSDGSHRSSAWPEENSEDEIRDNSDTTLFLTPPPMPLSMLDCFQSSFPYSDPGDSPSLHLQPSYPLEEWSFEESASVSPPPFENYLAATNQQLDSAEPGRYSQFLSKNDMIPERDLSTRSACYGPQGELIGYYPQSIDESEPMLVKYVYGQKAPWASMVHSGTDLSELDSKLEEVLGCRWGLQLQDEFF